MRTFRWILKPAAFIACLAPALRMAAGAFAFGGYSLGADPVAALLHGCGRWGLNLLLITLCMTPLKDLSGSLLPLRLRRMFGLYSFFYLALHFTVYVVLDQSANLAAVWQDIAKRPYITIGLLGLLLLIPLALTSTARSMRRLGRRWSELHRLIYVVAILGVWHFWWQVKRDIREPLLYACGLGLLLGYRLWKRRAAPARVSVGRLAEIDVV
ncbi:MAG TPA: protein-methionine-sulfoxide reductase heme-binding subunit MsrQ [Steroidobacteraceae bacterium]|nr:protein-methionine-sulfoxide reductase heme-binding subunit MsrQ [Steroidobacteraceae bacterium]